MKLSWFILLVACGPQTTPGGVALLTEDQDIISIVMREEPKIILAFEQHPLLKDVRAKIKGKKLRFGNTELTTCPNLSASQWGVKYDLPFIYALWARDCESIEAWGIDPDTRQIEPGSIFDVVYTIKLGAYGNYTIDYFAG